MVRFVFAEPLAVRTPNVAQMSLAIGAADDRRQPRLRQRLRPRSHREPITGLAPSHHGPASHRRQRLQVELASCDPVGCEYFRKNTSRPELATVAPGWRNPRIGGVRIDARETGHDPRAERSPRARPSLPLSRRRRTEPLAAAPADWRSERKYEGENRPGQMVRPSRMQKRGEPSAALLPVLKVNTATGGSSAAARA